MEFFRPTPKADRINPFAIYEQKLLHDGLYNTTDYITSVFYIKECLLGGFCHYSHRHIAIKNNLITFRNKNER